MSGDVMPRMSGKVGGEGCGKRIPTRTCVACRQVKPKHELVRVVHTPQGEIELDLRGKKAGRGVYLCKAKECWDAALTRGRKDRLAHSLKTEVSAESRATLSDYAKTFASNSMRRERGTE